MKKISIIAAFIAIMCTAACKALTPAEETALTKISATILCTLEGEEFDDPALNQACEEILPNLAPAQAAAVRAHLSKRSASSRKALKLEVDAGAEAGK